jgi:prevent-host-death family protein
MEKPVSAADANRKFSKLLRAVREGQSYVVTSHGRAVARIVPAAKNSGVTRAARAALLKGTHAADCAFYVDCRIAKTIERNNAFTVFDDLKMAAMSGSSTTAIASSGILEANRFGFDLW